MTAPSLPSRHRLSLLAVVLVLSACMRVEESDEQPATPVVDTEPPVIEPAPEQVADAVEQADEPATAEPQLPAPLMPAAFDAAWMQKGLFIGTWSLDPTNGMDEDWIGEADLQEVFTKERIKRREWSGFSTQVPKIPLDVLMQKKSGPIFGYIYSLVQRNRLDKEWPDEEAALHVTHRGPVKVWFDGELVLDVGAPMGGVATARARVTLTDAYDYVLIKVASEEGESMDLQVVLSKPDGSPVDSMAWNTVRIPGIPRDIPLRER